ncbi:hypothetical protein K438DRAFT_1874745, partial [Mycena galopus ATCC 62051]
MPGAIVLPISTSASASWDKASIIMEKQEILGTYNSFSCASLDIGTCRSLLSVGFIWAISITLGTSQRL